MDKPMLRSVNDVDVQGFDGDAHMAYYCPWRLLSFIWDGKAEYITVSNGGYGESPEWVIPAMIARGTPAEILDQYEEHCRAAINEWDTLYKDDDNYGYHFINPKYVRYHKLVPPPVGVVVNKYGPVGVERFVWEG